IASTGPRSRERGGLLQGYGTPLLRIASTGPRSRERGGCPSVTPSSAGAQSFDCDRCHCSEGGRIHDDWHIRYYLLVLKLLGRASAGGVLSITSPLAG